MPDLIDREISDFPNGVSQEKKNRLEIFYKGYFYDVTDFVDRHPGGSIIKFYTEPGEDATQAIQQFHFRSGNKVDAILKTFKKRPAGTHDQTLNSKTQTRHEALNADFKKLFEELHSEGYFEPSIRHTILRLVEAISLYILAFGVYNYVAEKQFLLGQHILALVVGFSMSRFGWLQHEGGHNSLTGRPKIDKMIQNFAMCAVDSGSSVWWNSQHNRHHAMPQRLARDVDLSTLPYVAFNKRAVNERKEINSFFIKYQALLVYTLDLSIVVVAWKFFIHPRYQLKKKAYFEMILNLPSYWLIYYYGLFWFFVASYWLAFFLGANFSLSHSHLEVADKPTHWVEYALTHTANITPSIFVDYWMGYLNYQIEHHLFPTMPQFRQREISHRVKALADKYNLPYTVYTYPEACILTMKNLNKVGQELTHKDNFSKTSNGASVT